MTRLRLADLPANVRAQVEIAAGRPARRAKSRAGTADGDPCPGHCTCGQTFTTYLAWERHADTEGHRRWELDLGRPVQPRRPTATGTRP